MRRQLREFPTHLPHARLYLDDIESIIQIVAGEIQPSSDASAVGPPLKVIYRIRREEMDSVADLLERGGSTSKLEIDISTDSGAGYSTASLEFDGSGAPTLRIYGVEENAKWSIYGRVRDLFETRRSTLKNIVEAIPSPIAFLGWMSLCSAQVVEDVLKVIQNTFARDLVSGTYVAIVVIVITCFAIHFLPNRVYLVRSHERSKVSSENRRRYVERAIIFVLGAVGADLIHHYVTRFLK